MSVNSWDPSAAKATENFQINIKQLEQFIQLSQNDQLDKLNERLSQQDQQIQANLMKQNKESWFSISTSLSDEKIIDLIKFFTIAESLPGWEAGDNSPVIWLGKVLKKRGAGISKELTLWIKSNSNNQFLPHGALL